MATQKPPKTTLRLTFRADLVTAYKLKALAKAAQLPFPEYLRQCVLRDAGIAR